MFDRVPGIQVLWSRMNSGVTRGHDGCPQRRRQHLAESDRKLDSNFAETVAVRKRNKHFMINKSRTNHSQKRRRKGIDYGFFPGILPIN